MQEKEKQDIHDQITYFTRCKGWHDGMNFRYLVETSVETQFVSFSQSQGSQFRKQEQGRFAKMASGLDIRGLLT